MGCLFSNALRQAGCDITLIVRDSSTPSEVMVEHASHSDRFPVAHSHYSDSSSIDNLLVTTKAYDVDNALASIAHRLEKYSQVVLLVNGMGFLKNADAALPPLCCYPGTSTEGAYRLDKLHIRHAGTGTTRLGQPGTDTPPLWFDNWSNSPLDCVWENDIEQALWHKLAINCAINPLTAVHQCPNGDLLKAEKLKRELDFLNEEIALVADAAGFTKIASDLEKSVEQVIKGTAGNFSSMLQDVTAGRRTEIDYITGYLLSEAERLGMDTPHNRQLYARVKSFEY